MYVLMNECLYFGLIKLKAQIFDGEHFNETKWNDDILARHKSECILY